MDFKMKHIPITEIVDSLDGHQKDYYWNQMKPDESSKFDFIGSDNHVDEVYYKIIAGIDKGESDKGCTSTTTLRISSLEKKLFDLLMAVVRESGCGTVLRVAGGWVRDKLRGDNSHDIDIALDNIMGEPFADLVNKHLERNHQETHRVGVIQSNPEQSKHLETATVKIFDVWVDFVNLRSETYTENSRIPSITFGSPLEDALRRDLTINSLFFNINENKIEDYTKTAIKDLQLGIIRTPLPPLTTFLDDPLRVFRSIRFATRMYFAIDENLIEAASDSKVKDAILNKIAHERIAKEFEGMITGPRPDLAMHLILKLGLYQYLFAIPSNFKEFESNDYKSESTNYIYQMMRIVNWGETTNLFKRIRLLASLMIPFHQKVFINTAKKNRTLPLIQFTLMDHLKLSNKDYDDVILILDCAKLFLPLIREFKESSSFNRKKVGLIIHKAGQLWRTALSIALVIELPPHSFNHSFPLHKSSSEPTLSSSTSSFNHHTHQHPHHQPLCDESKSIVSLYDQFCTSIQFHDLIGIWNVKPLLDGNQVKEILKKPPGPWLSPVLQKIFEWQLENPTKSVDDCKEWLISNSK